MSDKRSNHILTFRQFCEEYEKVDKERFARMVSEEGFPAVKDSSGMWKMARIQVNQWYSRKGLKVVS